LPACTAGATIAPRPEGRPSAGEQRTGRQLVGRLHLHSLPPPNSGPGPSAPSGRRGRDPTPVIPTSPSPTRRPGARGPHPRWAGASTALAAEEGW